MIRDYVGKKNPEKLGFLSTSGSLENP